MEGEQKKFSFHVFLIHLTSRKLWVWLLSSWFVREIVTKNGDHGYFLPLIIGWIAISVIYLIGDPIEKGIGTMLENAKITAELKAGAQTIIETAKTNGGKDE
jgi:hypothetical protein